MITILGATGKVGEKIAEALIKRGEKVRLVARTADRLRPIVGKNAQAFAGDAMDTEFLVKAFEGSDAVFTLLPPNFQADNFLAYDDKIGESIARALELAKVRWVVNLSSVGAELSNGTGPIIGLNHLEQRLNKIEGLNVLHMRCAYFMENLLWNVDVIKTKGVNGDMLRGDSKMPMIATKDIAAFAADRLQKRDFSGSSIRYLLGPRDVSMIEVTGIIGRKINKPDLVYVMVSYDDFAKDARKYGLSDDVGRGFVDMSRAFNEGRVAIPKRAQENTTPTSVEEFCDQVFMPLYSQKKAA